MTWDCSLADEIASEFDAYTYRHDDVSDALVQWSAYVAARKRERDSSPKRREYMRAYNKQYHRRPDAKEAQRRRQSAPEYLAHRRAYMAGYLERNAAQKAAAVERARRWRDANRERFRAYQRQYKQAQRAA